MEVTPDQLWLSANPNICTYPIVADLKEREPNTVTPFVVVKFSHHEHLHLPRDHIVAFTEKDCKEGEVKKFAPWNNWKKNYPEIGYQKENGRKSSVNFSRTHSCKKTMIS